MAEKYQDLPVFDEQEALRRCMGKKDFVEELSRIFVNESLPMYLPRLTLGIEENDSLQVVKNAHGIKGGCAAIGLVRARDMAYDMEKAGKKNDMKAVTELFPVFLDELEKAVQFINSGNLFPQSQ